MQPRDIITFGRNKSKYWIELNLRVILFHIENHELFFTASISKEHDFYHSNNFTNTHKDQICY